MSTWTLRRFRAELEANFGRPVRVSLWNGYACVRLSRTGSGQGAARHIAAVDEPPTPATVSTEPPPPGPCLFVPIGPTEDETARGDDAYYLESPADTTHVRPFLTLHEPSAQSPEFPAADLEHALCKGVEEALREEVETGVRKVCGLLQIDRSGIDGLSLLGGTPIKQDAVVEEEEDREPQPG